MDVERWKNNWSYGVNPPQGRHFVEAIQSAMGRFQGRPVVFT
jgi:hypothetical protein